MGKSSISPIRPGKIAAGGAPPVSTPKAAKRQPLMTIRGLRKSFNDAVVYDDFGVICRSGSSFRSSAPTGAGRARSSTWSPA
jgi:NitT/TauT family transport system ATP-binding protein